ncbi:MAG: GNAT family N-acetyltransferase [Olsenella sp.]
METSHPIAASSLEYAFEVALSDRHAVEVRRLLESCGDEFMPPLSTRMSTHQTDLRCLEGTGTRPGEYFSELSHQPFALALSDGRVVAFLSFIEGYPVMRGEKRLVTTYVTTICVAPEWRHRGIATGLYRVLERCSSSRYFSVRTWSTNAAQVTLLQSLGYRELSRIRDDRSEGIDTIYFLKDLSEDAR